MTSTPVVAIAKHGASFNRAAARELRRITRLLRVAAHLMIGVVVAHTLLGWATRGSARGAQLRAAVTQYWTRRLCRILNLQITVHGTVSRAPTLFVANHLSWLDIPCLHAVLATDFVGKQEVAQWPLVGAMARKAGTMFLRRGDRLAVEAVGERMTWLFKRGHSVILFPEGTTTDGSVVQRFHSRLFQPALRTHAPVQAVAVTYPHPAGVHPAAPFVGDDNLLRHLWALLAESSIDVTLTFCPALATAASNRRRIVAEHTRGQIVAALGLDEVPRQRLVRAL